MEVVRFFHAKSSKIEFVVQVFFGFEELMAKRSRKDKTSRRKSVKAYRPKRQHATRTAAVERPLKYAEKKNIDTSLNAAGTITENAVAPILSLVTTTQGAGAGNRIGRRILVKSIFIRGRVACAGNMTGVGFFRMIIVQDKDPNGAGAPAPNAILDNDIITSMQNLGNSKRFKILAEITTPNGTSLSVDTDEGFLIERYIKTNIVVGYSNSAAAGTAADILSNAIWCLFYLGGGTTGSNPPNFNGSARVRFVDY